MEWKMKTQIVPPFEIKQELTALDDMEKEISGSMIRWVYGTRDKGMREALIRLGWTPPVHETPLDWKP